jgi:crossover junction endodeoxyribonuclease RusA
MPEYTIDIPLAHRKWITANQRLHWASRWRQTRLWREAGEIGARNAMVPHMERALIICELHWFISRRRDPANWAPTAKAIVDGLVDARVLDDDDHKHCLGPDMRTGSRPLGTPWEGVHVRILPIPRDYP